MTPSHRTSEEELDLALAAELQAALLPKGCPITCPNQVAAARNRMCGSIGGDFYDFLQLSQDQIAVVIGDVVGHGVRSSLVMAQIMGFLRFAQERRTRPPEMITSLNRMLIDLGERTGVITPCSIFYGVIDTPTGICMCVNAGHPRPYLCDSKSGQIHPLNAHNFLLGIEDFEPVEICLTFEPGQRLVLFTDGLVDATNATDEHFGEQRLHQLVVEHVSSGPEQCADAIFDAVANHRDGRWQMDDETLVVLDRVHADS